MIDVEGIAKVLSDIKASHAKNSRVVMGDASEMDELFGINWGQSPRNPCKRPVCALLAA